MRWNLRWLREVIENPPSNFIPRVGCPVLLLHGELDHNIPVAEVPLLMEAFENAGNEKVTARTFQGLDHSFRRLGDPGEDFITAMRRPLDPVMVNALEDWLRDLAF